jgi:hypothetical protein
MMAEIEGRGLVVFICKNGERRSFAGVYFTLRLMVNIVSVGQLDEASYDIHIKNARMDIREPGGWLLARVQRKENMALCARRQRRIESEPLGGERRHGGGMPALGMSTCQSCRGW